MKESLLLMIPILLPVLAGVLLFVMPEFKNRKVLCAYVGAALVLTGGFVLWNLVGDAEGFVLFYLTKTLPIYFKLDGMGKIFLAIVTLVWIIAGFFSFEYMKHEQNEKRYYGFYLVVYGVLIGLNASGNLVTFYLFYELMTLTSLPMVLHTGTREALLAGLKYLLYSLCGAYMVLFGLYFVYRYGNTLTFTAGGVLNMELSAGHETLLLVCAMLMIVGFGVKAGMFPLHAWLTAAHPVAPAPASAVLSGIIVKGGVLGIIRVVFYIFGADFLNGTWVQKTWIVLTLLTVFMGSLMAYREKVLKRRLAYSTISQVSYILFGLAMMNPASMEGALLHAICHAFTKCGLFLAAGAIIYKTGKTRVNELRGIGKEMPVTIWCFTFLSLTLIGIPPTGGFLSKWYLGIGSLETGISVVCWLGPVILLISALLTAGYLLPITVNGFLPGADYDYNALQKKEPNLVMLIPLILLTIVAVGMGLFPDAILGVIESAGGGIL